MCRQLLACLQNCSLPFLYRHDTWYLSLVCSIIPAGIRCIKYIKRGTRWRSWLRHNAKSREASGSIVDGFSGIYHWHNYFRPHYDPWFDSFCNRNEYQKYFLGGKGGPVRRADNLTTFIGRLSWNLGASVSWNPQGLSRPVMGLLYLFYDSYFHKLYFYTRGILKINMLIPNSH